MKVRDIIFIIVFVPVLYQFYLVFSGRLNTELAVMLTAWLAIIAPMLWFKCKSGCELKKRASKVKHYLGNRQLGQR